MKLFDCFMYNNEDLLLELRLNILEKIVHKFIIVESCYDHQGNKKKLNFDLKKFKKFKKKISYIVLKNFPKNLSNWQRENYNRNYLAKGLSQAKNEDLIMISDLDEIPNIPNINIFNKKKFTVFNQKMIYYRFNLQDVSNPNWQGTKVCKKKYLKSPQWLRSRKVKTYPYWRIDKKIWNIINDGVEWNIINDGGWHFSYIMNEKKIINKIKSFAHSELNNKKYLKSKLIKKKILQKKDIFGRSIKLKKIKNENILPNYLINNKKNFKNFFI